MPTGDHGHIGTVYRSSPLQDYRTADGRQSFATANIWRNQKGKVASLKRLDADKLTRFTVGQHSDRVVERHGFDVERRQNGFLVGQRGVVVAGNFGRQYDAHVAQIDVDGTQVGPTQRRSLYERVIDNIVVISFNDNTKTAFIY